MLITGADGFIGSYLAQKLTRLGHLVIGLDERTPDSHDLRSVILKVPTCDAIIHLARFKGSELGRSLGLRDALKLANHWSAKRFVYASSLPETLGDEENESFAELFAQNSTMKILALRLSEDQNHHWIGLDDVAVAFAQALSMNWSRFENYRMLQTTSSSLGSSSFASPGFLLNSSANL